MKILLQLATIFIICLVGEFLVGFLPFQFPSSVMSMILLFLLLFSKIIKQEQIKDTGDFFLKNMAFFFIPAGVAIMDYFDILKESIFLFLLVCFITTIIVFWVTVNTVTLVMRIQEKRRAGKKHD